MNIAYANILYVGTLTGQQYFHLALPSLSPEVNILTSIPNIIMSILSLGPRDYRYQSLIRQIICVTRHGHRAQITDPRQVCPGDLDLFRLIF